MTHQKNYNLSSSTIEEMTRNGLEAIPELVRVIINSVMQATEAIKWIVGIGHPLIGELLIYNALDISFTRVSVEKNPDCPICGG